MIGYQDYGQFRDYFEVASLLTKEISINQPHFFESGKKLLLLKT